MARNPEAVTAIVGAIGAIGDWIKGNPEKAAEELAPSTGIPTDALELAISRQSFGVAPLTPAVIADQQKVADTFQRLGLLPKPVEISKALADGS